MSGHHFTGLAVGGSQDGKVLVGNETTTLVFEPLPEPTYEPQDDPPSHDASRQEVYYFTSIQMAPILPGDEPVTHAFWVLRGKTVVDAMREVMESYARPKPDDNSLEGTVYRLGSILSRVVYNRRNDGTTEIAEAHEALDAAKRLLQIRGRW